MSEQPFNDEKIAAPPAEEERAVPTPEEEIVEPTPEEEIVEPTPEEEIVEPPIEEEIVEPPIEEEIVEPTPEEEIIEPLAIDSEFDAKTKRLENDVKSREGRIDELLSEIEELHAQIDAKKLIERELTTIRDQLDIKESKIAELEAQLVETDQKIASLESEVVSVDTADSPETKEKIALLEAKIAEQEAELEKVAELDALKNQAISERDTLIGQLDEFKIRTDVAEQKLAELESSPQVSASSADEVDDLRLQVERLTLIASTSAYNDVYEMLNLQKTMTLRSLSMACGVNQVELIAWLEKLETQGWIRLDYAGRDDPNPTITVVEK
ncbi:MAG: hypothetical protein ACTSYA_02540 [Candidatus Kariarchaeaceae archaeon]